MVKIPVDQQRVNQPGLGQNDTSVQSFNICVNKRLNIVPYEVTSEQYIGHDLHLPQRSDNSENHKVTANQMPVFKCHLIFFSLVENLKKKKVPEMKKVDFAEGKVRK